MTCLAGSALRTRGSTALPYWYATTATRIGHVARAGISAGLSWSPSPTAVLPSTSGVGAARKRRPHLHGKRSCVQPIRTGPRRLSFAVPR